MSSSVWLIIGVIGAGTLLLRLSCFFFSGKRELPQALLRPLRFVPAAVLSALVTPAILAPEGTLHLAAGNVRLLAGIIAVAVAAKSRSILPTLAAGMLSLWILQALARSYS